MDVFKTKCLGHNVILSRGETCPRCIDAMRAASPRALRASDEPHVAVATAERVDAELHKIWDHVQALQESAHKHTNATGTGPVSTPIPVVKTPPTQLTVLYEVHEVELSLRGACRFDTTGGRAFILPWAKVQRLMNESGWEEPQADWLIGAVLVVDGNGVREIKPAASAVAPRKLEPAKYTAPSGEEIEFREYPRVRVVDLTNTQCVREAAEYGDTLRIWMNAGLITNEDACRLADTFTRLPLSSWKSAGFPLWDSLAQLWALRKGDEVLVWGDEKWRAIEGSVVIRGHHKGRHPIAAMGTQGERGFAVLEVRSGYELCA